MILLINLPFHEKTPNSPVCGVLLVHPVCKFATYCPVQAFDTTITLGVPGAATHHLTPRPKLFDLCDDFIHVIISPASFQPGHTHMHCILVRTDHPRVSALLPHVAVACMYAAYIDILDIYPLHI